MYRLFFKRFLDLVLSLIAIVILSPVFIIVAVLVRMKLESPVIFCQERPGRDEKIFKMYKFRSMTSETDEKGNLLPDEVRMTKFGKLLRSTSLDELPELFNILKGDMSIVGPRPLLVKYLPLYNEKQKHRHDVRPGFTGYAQVNGRNSISWEEKFDLDVEYVNNFTFMMDVRIIIKTIKVVLFKEGISSETSVTMEEFKGNRLLDNGAEIKSLEEKNNDLLTNANGKKIYIIGAGGHGKVVADIAKNNGYETILFFDDSLKGKIGLYSIVGTTDDIERIKQFNKEASFFIAIGNNEVRENLFRKLNGVSLPVLIHNSAVVDETVKIGEGTVIMGNAVINAGTTIGKNCIINTGATVDHDCVIDDYVHISPGVHLAGTVHIGKRTWIGIGSAIINNINICNDVIVGAGTTVINDIGSSGKYVGVPLRRI